MLREIFPFLEEKHHMVSLVGAGGKTTLMYLLAEEYKSRGDKVLVTTTTHIKNPLSGMQGIWTPEELGEKVQWAGEESQVKELWKAGKIPVIGTETAEGKLAMPESAFFLRCCDLADQVLVEADGSKGMPCKVPADFEPVLLPQSDIVIGVMGMDALGKTIEESCFRAEETSKLLGTHKEHCLTEEDMVKILSSEKGTRKQVGSRPYYVVLTKCDDGRRRKSAEKIRTYLGKKGIFQVACMWVGQDRNGGKKIWMKK